MSLSFSMRVVPSPDVMFRTVGDEAVLLNLKTEMYLGSDAVGTRMWTLLAESDSIQSAYEALLQEFEVEPATLRQDLEEFIGKLAEHQLVEIKPGNVSIPDPALDKVK